MLKPIQFLLVLIAILCVQMPAWATIGLAEWSISTPGGNTIGNNDTLPPKVGTAIYRGDRVYVDRLGNYGFYDGVIIGETDRKFFLFDESTKAVTKFSTKEQLCADVRAKGLKFNNNLRFFPGSYPYDYYVIRYALYFSIPFILLLVIHAIAKQQIPLAQRIDRILMGNSFLLQLLGLSGFLKFAFTNAQTDDLMLEGLILTIVAVGIIGTLLWLLSRFSLRILDRINLLSQYRDSSFLALFKCTLVGGIMTAGLYLTIGQWESSWTSIKYFSCL
ncbi:hypothetical protein V2H45_03455 [Tumidithrix elongata RA019]|uniref:Uncharacterized protein n=1 Tax=Tumidithrix elongata BACA0141 TaxID=2716417 RepID=A0AAW9PXV6_9CYAN|nr:hypothetical protein [Tumidithrix elongata RA019]